MNIGFYLTNHSFSEVDCTNIDNGNPGIGGTHYAMLMLCYLLSKQKTSKDNYYLFAESTKNIPKDISAIQVDDLKKLKEELKENRIDVLVVNKIGSNTLDKRFFDTIYDVNVKIIVWAHCFIPLKELNYYSANPKVKKIVAVGHEEMMTWVDHPIFRKATSIYNICNYPELDIPQFQDRKNNVVYIGCITKLKGLHLLTKAWPRIRDKIHDAHLYIIGGGNLYDRNAELGKFGIAEYFYEKEVLKPILTPNGTIDESVTFCGVLGEEKFDILKHSKVGVPNPSGLTETFGYTAIEMQLAGSLVTTMRCPGYSETVFSEDHILYDNPSELADSVITLLSKQDYSPRKSIDYIRTSFSNDTIVRQWRILLEEVVSDIYPYPDKLDSNLRSNKRRIRNRKYQNYVSWLPPIMAYEELWNKASYFYYKLLDLPTTLHKIYRREIK